MDFRRRMHAAAIGGIVLACLAAGCRTSSGGRTVQADRPAAPPVESAAILPFENLTEYVNAEQIVSSVLWTELQAAGVRLASSGDTGRGPGVEYLISGKVVEFQYRHGLNEQANIGLVVHLSAARDKRIVWSGSYASSARSSLTSAPASLTEVTLELCRAVAADLTAGRRKREPGG